MSRAKTVEEYIESAEHWRDELVRLREIIASTELEETVKWGAPCYTLDGSNVVAVAAFRSYVGLWFFQGALLSDPEGVLVNAQEGKTKAMRQWRFTSAEEIEPRLITAYLREAIDLQARGETIPPDRDQPIVVPTELEAAFKKDAKARAAFEKLTPGKRREYATHVADAKREETRRRRVDTIIPMILEGKGLHDKYRSC